MSRPTINKRTLISKKTAPAVDTIQVATQYIHDATDAEGKLLGLRAGSIGIAEINFRRTKKILQLAEAVENQLIEKMLTDGLDLQTDQLMSLYRTLLISNKDAAMQIDSVIKQDDAAALLRLINKDGPEAEAAPDITAEVVAALRQLNES